LTRSVSGDLACARTSRCSRSSTSSGETISAKTPSAAWANASARVGPHARTPTSASTSNCSHPASVIGTPRLRSACRGSSQVPESRLEDGGDRRPRRLRAEDPRADAHDPPAPRAYALDFLARQSALWPDQKVDARVWGQSGGQALSECRSERKSLPPTLPRRRGFPQAEPEIGGLIERD